MDSSYGMVSISLGIVSIPSAESCGIRISSRVVKSAVVEAEGRNVIEIDHYGGFPLAEGHMIKKSSAVVIIMALRDWLLLREDSKTSSV